MKTWTCVVCGFMYDEALGLPTGVASLARLRRELFAFVRAGLVP